MDGCVGARRSDGLYLHLPLHPDRCLYCAFASPTALEPVAAVIEATIPESGRYRRRRELANLNLGRGMPPLDSRQRLAEQFRPIFGAFVPSPGAGVTLNASPENLSAVAPAGRRAPGVTRLSDHAGVAGWR